jgi:hypothetical protein
MNIDIGEYFLVFPSPPNNNMGSSLRYFLNIDNTYIYGRCEDDLWKMPSSSYKIKILI